MNRRAEGCWFTYEIIRSGLVGQGGTCALEWASFLELPDGDAGVMAEGGIRD